MNNKTSAFSQKALIKTGSLLLAGTASVYAHPEAIEELEPSTILASRFETANDDTTSAIGIITGEELANQQQYRLQDTLNFIPGIQGVAFGNAGTPGSALTRGLSTAFTQVVVDGVRISDNANPIGNFLTTANVSQLSQVEVLRGPQAVLYGSGATGGVIGLNQAVGGANKTTIFAEGGSFDSYRSSVSSQGSVGQLEYGFEIGKEFTDNDPDELVPVEDFEVDTRSLSLKWNASDDFSLKFTYRGTESNFDTVNTLNFNPISDVDIKNNLYAINADYVVNDLWTTKLTLGFYDEDSRFISANEFDGSRTTTELDRFSLNWNSKLTFSESFSLVAGYEYSDTTYENTTLSTSPFFPADNEDDIDLSTDALYVNSYWRPVNQLLIESGFRIEEQNEEGGNTAWNIGASYEIDSTGTLLKARVAESFRTPTILDTGEFFGGFSPQIANPDLDTETVLGFEFGIEQQVAGSHFVELTYFNQRVDDAVATEFNFDPSLGFVSQRVNQDGKSTVSGFEFAARGSFYDGKVKYRLAWTAQDKEEVIDVPDHTVTADINYDGGNWLIGVGASYVDGATYAPSDNAFATELDDRIVARLYGHYEINDNVKLHARVENLFDQDYELSPFGDNSSGNGIGAFAGVTVSF